MQFTFRRDEEGVERIYVGDLPIARLSYPDINIRMVSRLLHVDGVGQPVISDAIERAGEAMFWSWIVDSGQWLRNDVTVDVPVAGNATLSVTTEEDES